MDIEFKIEGLDGVIDRISRLADRVQKSSVRKAARRAMNLVRDSARARASRIDDPSTVPPLGSQIYRNIITQESRRGRQQGGILMRVGVRGGSVTRKGVKRIPSGIGGTTPHFRHLELGTEHTRAQPFMLPALMENIGAVTDTLVEELKIELDRLGV